MDGIDHKGYFRLNDECQECPENPELIIAALLSALILFIIAAWWLEDKKINVAFLSIGVDYFQVLAIFARIPIKWPYWVKTILQILSIFNFNIGKQIGVLLWRTFRSPLIVFFFDLCFVPFFSTLPFSCVPRYRGARMHHS